MRYTYLKYDLNEGANRNFDRKIFGLAAVVLVIALASIFGVINNRSERQASSPGGSSQQASGSSDNKESETDNNPNTDNATAPTPVPVPSASVGSATTAPSSTPSGVSPVTGGRGSGGSSTPQAATPDPAATGGSGGSADTPPATGGTGSGGGSAPPAEECILPKKIINGICQLLPIEVPQL
jgi:hypothetical protein